jgi:MHS family proline/betaine transporter-like MFS transporter
MYHSRILAAVVLTVMLHDLSFYVLFVYMTTYLTEVIHLSKDAAFTINTINLLMVGCMTLGSAWLSDRIGRKKVLALAALLFIAGTIPLFNLIDSQNVTTILLAQMAFAIAVGGYFGPIPALLVESFPTNIRYSAVSIAVNISGPLFGGTAPMVVTYLIGVTGYSQIPALYLTMGAILSLVALQYVGKQVIALRLEEREATT